MSSSILAYLTWATITTDSAIPREEMVRRLEAVGLPSSLMPARRAASDALRIAIRTTVERVEVVEGEGENRLRQTCHPTAIGTERGWIWRVHVRTVDYRGREVAYRHVANVLYENEHLEAELVDVDVPEALVEALRILDEQQAYWQNHLDHSQIRSMVQKVLIGLKVRPSVVLVRPDQIDPVRKAQEALSGLPSGRAEISLYPIVGQEAAASLHRDLSLTADEALESLATAALKSDLSERELRKLLDEVQNLRVNLSFYEKQLGGKKLEPPRAGELEEALRRRLGEVPVSA